jgi:hypothetical protein
VRIIALVAVLFTVGCVNVNNICPHKPITQGVFGEVVDATGALEENVEVDIYSVLNGMQDMKFGGVQTTRGGYQFNALASTYILCAKTVCATVDVPTGIVELSAIDAASGLTWNAPVAVPPAQKIGPCTFGE